MSIDHAKDLDINHLLERLGHRPTKRTAKDTWYKRPYGHEQLASFHVSRDGRAWYDFGTGTGGNIIDLAMLLGGGSDVSSALAYLESLTGYSPAPARQPSLLPHHTSYRTESSRPLADSQGEQWCRSRALEPDRCRPYLMDVYYNRTNKPYKKPLYGVGIPNLWGGFEIRTKLEGGHWAKSSVGPKDITVFKSGREHALWVSFEGMPDFCTFLTVKAGAIGENNYLILNGTGLTDKAIAYLKTQPKGYLIICSQAGQGGQQSKEKLRHFMVDTGWEGSDIDHYWQGYQDYNAWYMATKGVRVPTAQASPLKATPKLDV